MIGFQITFFTQQDRRHGRTPLGEWLLLEAKKLGLSGATLTGAGEGFGHDGKLHSAHFFELADQPIEVTMAVTAEDADRLLQRLHEEKVNVFYVKAPIEFGMTEER
jgi:PII-like signaling protein